LWRIPEPSMRVIADIFRYVSGQIYRFALVVN
jgi:hypothetical protein